MAARSNEVAFIVSLAGPGVAGAELTPMQVRALLEAQAELSEDAIDALVDAQRAVMEVIRRDGDDAEVLSAVRRAVKVGLEQAPAEERNRASQLHIDAKVELEAQAVCSAWYRSFVKLDPREWWRRAHCPALVLIGGKDLQVPAAENLDAIRTAVEGAGNPDVTFAELPGLNHMFQPAKTGLVSEYAEIEQTIDPAALDLMTTWLRQQAGLE